MNSLMRALFALGQSELTTTIAVADIAVYFGRNGAIGPIKMVVTIEGEDAIFVMENITNEEMMAIVEINLVDESEINSKELNQIWAILGDFRKRIPKGFEMFTPFP